MADETPKKKKTIPLPPKKDEPATPAPEVKPETLDEKISRLEKEAKLAKLEKEAASRNRPPVVERTKEAVKTGAVKTKEGIVTGVKAVGKGVDIVKQKTGMVATRSPVTGRMVDPPSLFERGITSLADVGSWLSNKTKTAFTPQTIEQKINSQGSLEDLETIRAKRLSEQATKSAAKTNAKFRQEVLREEALGPEGRAREKIAARTDIPKGKKLVITKNGFTAIVDKNIPDVAVTVPFEERMALARENIEFFIKENSPLLNYKNRRNPTVAQGAVEGARGKIKKMLGDNSSAEDFLVKALNRSNQFTSEEVSQLARSLVEDPQFRKTLEESQLFDTYERPNSRLSGGAPKPIDKGASKFTYIQDDYGNEVKVTPEGRTSWAQGKDEPPLGERLARFKNQKADTALAAQLAREAEAEAIRASVAPYGGKSPSTATGPQAQAELRNEIETRQRSLAAQRAEAELAKQATRARIEGANNQAEQAFLKRLEAQRQAATAQRGVEANATWDFRTPEDINWERTGFARDYSGTFDPATGQIGTPLRLASEASGITSTNPTANIKAAEEYAYLKWLHSRATVNNIPSTGGVPLRGITAESIAPRFLNMGRAPTLGGIGAAGGVVGGVLAPLQIYEQIKSANSSDPIEAGYGASDPLALRGLMDLALDPVFGGMTAKAAGRSYEKKANDPRYIEKSPITSAVGQAARGNPAYLKALVNNLAYYGDSPYGWGLFSDEQPRNLNEQGAR